MDINQLNHRLITTKGRIKLFIKIYWKNVFTIVIPFLLLPIAFIAENRAYKSFYIFLIFAVYMIADVLPACVTALVPVALVSILAYFDTSFVNEIFVRCSIVDCFGVMILIVAIEESGVNRRIALKILLIFGCSHYKLSFLLFFSSMFLSMWISNTVGCGLMIPIVKSVLHELETLGILEVNQTVGKDTQRSSRHELNLPRPTDFTVFYYLGIAYSASIGGMSTLSATETNQVYKTYCDSIFPKGPKIEFPQFMLLSLPGVILLESLFYMWMNFYFLGMFRNNSDLTFQVSMTEEEGQYVKAILVTQYLQLGTMSSHEIVVSISILLAVLLQATISTVLLDDQTYVNMLSHVKIFVPSMISAVFLFLTPRDFEFTKFFRKGFGTEDGPLPNRHGKGCLNWNLINSGVHWSVLIIIGGSSCLFETLKHTEMTTELEKFLRMFSICPAPALVLVVILFCKVLSEFAPSPCIVYCLLPHIARLSVVCHVNPHYLMTAAALASSLPFHLVTGCPNNAMVAAYANISAYKMMQAGVGPSLIAVIVSWFTVTLWAKAIWPDINIFPKWANFHVDFDRI